jgi:hypothetical protein
VDGSYGGHVDGPDTVHPGITLFLNDPGVNQINGRPAIAGGVFK